MPPEEERETSEPGQEASPEPGVASERAAPPESEAVLFSRPSMPDVAAALEDEEEYRVSLSDLEPADEEAAGSPLGLMGVLPLRKKLRDARKSVMVNTAGLIRRLDPSEPEGMRIDPHSGEHLLPGYVALAPLTFLAFLLNSGAFVSVFVYSTRSNPDYLFPFAIAYTILMFHLYFYHISYHTRRRFRATRQVLFVLVFEVFLNFILWDLIQGSSVAAGHRWLWAAFGCNAGMASIVFLHFLVLGRGYRRVKDPAPNPKTKRS